MKYGSLFSGIGGFDLGFERAGMECAWQVEIDEKCQNVLRRHFPNTEVFSDVKQCGKHNLTAVDLICGGFPCQDLSVAGRRAGLAGERSGLWFEFHRILAEVKPGWVVIENVPGLLSSNRGMDFAVILRGLVELGYGVCWRILDAQYFGVAQRRRRVFIVGHLGDGRAAQVLFEREGGAGDTPPSREKGKGVAPTLSGSPNKTGGDRPPGTQVETAESLVVAAPLVAWQAKGAFTDPVNDNIITSTLRGFGHGWQGQHNDTNAVIDTGWDYQRLRIHDADGIVPTMSQADGKGGQGMHPPAIAWHNKQQSGEIRIQGDTVNAVTQQWGTGGNNVPFVGVRRLTPVECERLQGFPDGWTDGQADSTRYRQLGNAVAVPCAEFIGRRLMEQL